jgi:hypothetical protein
MRIVGSRMDISPSSIKVLSSEYLCVGVLEDFNGGTLRGDLGS